VVVVVVVVIVIIIIIIIIAVVLVAVWRGMIAKHSGHRGSNLGRDRWRRISLRYE
jgi:hypothetical protein